jgi:sRNA-binding carbon storage regulator CsrA
MRRAGEAIRIGETTVTVVRVIEATDSAVAQVILNIVAPPNVKIWRPARVEGPGRRR